MEKKISMGASLFTWALECVAGIIAVVYGLNGMSDTASINAVGEGSAVQLMVVAIWGYYFLAVIAGVWCICPPKYKKLTKKMLSQM